MFKIFLFGRSLRSLHAFQTFSKMFFEVFSKFSPGSSPLDVLVQTFDSSARWWEGSMGLHAREPRQRKHREPQHIEKTHRKYVINML